MAPGAGALVIGTIGAATWSGNELINKPIENAERQTAEADKILTQRELERINDISTWLKVGKGHEWLKASGVEVANLNELVHDDGKPSENLFNDLNTKDFYLSQILDQGIVPFVFYNRMHGLDEGLKQRPDALINYINNESYPHSTGHRKLFAEVLTTCGYSPNDLSGLCTNGLFQKLLSKVNNFPHIQKRDLLTREVNQCMTIVERSLEDSTDPKIAALHAVSKK